MLNGVFLPRSTAYHGPGTRGFDCQPVVKSSSFAKSIIHISSLQLELLGLFFARLDEIIGSGAGGTAGTGPSFFQSFPIFCSASNALASINPSGFGATFKIKLQWALFNG